jgi:stress response protein SCP2
VHIATFNSKVEKLILEGKASEVVSLLRERPGDFARRLDHLLRLCDRNESSQRFIINAFMKVASFVSTPVLLQLLAHFKSRNTANMRVVFPKGNIAKVQAIEGARRPIPADACGRVVLAVEHALNERFAELPKLGKVYVDPLLADYLVPFSQRSASKSLRTLVRGSKVAFPAGKNTLRFFIHWKNQNDAEERYDNGRVDLDLSALMYDTEFKYKTHISYFNLRDSEYKAVHSGDITNAPKGACEFIDVDIPSMLAYGGRYVIMMVNNFTHQPFNEIPECFAGWMLREKPQSGEVFEAKTVQDKVDLTSESTSQVMPLIIDLLTRKVIWADAAIGARAGYANNIRNNYDIITLIGQAFTKIAKPTLYDLFTLHAEARGKLVTDPKKADVVFSVAAGTPFELETIASEYMKNPEKKVKGAKA